MWHQSAGSECKQHFHKIIKTGSEAKNRCFSNYHRDIKLKNERKSLLFYFSMLIT